jgi:ribosomal protein S27AE
MVDFITLSCPSCGNKLQITSDIDRFACGACGNEYVVIRKGGIVALKPVHKNENGHKLETWGGRSSFKYSGSVETGTEIIFGKGWKAKISAEEYIALRRHFMGRIVNIGTSRTEPPEGSLGKWLQANVKREAIACYIGPILIIEGYAKRIKKHEICITK